jgi:CubicO group peptidase (beta-lactamase class C family)
MQFAAVVLTLSFLTQFAAAADVAPEKVDQILAGYNKGGSPGCSLGVIRNGDFVYRKAYGLGSLELEVPLTSKSVFYMGSVSKQFTAAAVVLAAEQGFLSLDDDVRKYIPELPDYGHAITLRQMLHHTSGFRNFLDLIYLSGRDALDFNSPHEILGLIDRQKGLNNTPRRRVHLQQHQLFSARRCHTAGDEEVARRLCCPKDISAIRDVAHSFL